MAEITLKPIGQWNSDSLIRYSVDLTAGNAWMGLVNNDGTYGYRGRYQGGFTGALSAVCTEFAIAVSSRVTEISNITFLYRFGGVKPDPDYVIYARVTHLTDVGDNVVLSDGCDISKSYSYDVHPDTGDPLTIEDVDDYARLLMYSSSSNAEARCHQMWKVVTYVPAVPLVTTQAVLDIGDVTATGHGNITDTGGANATKRGICYNTTGSPTVADEKVEETGDFGTGAFSEKLIKLSPNTLYYVRAYAMNETGYAYGNEVEFTTRLTEWIAYGEWVKFGAAAPGSPGDRPSGYKNDVCSDYSGYTYILNRSLTDDGASYESHFILSTDLSGKKTLHTNKRLEDIFSYFANKGAGTAKVYVKRDNEAAWQEAGEISLTGEEEIIIKHLPVDFLAKTYLIKFFFENDFEFIGIITEAISIGERP